MKFSSRRHARFLPRFAAVLLAVSALLPGVSWAEAYDAAYQMVTKFNLGNSLDPISYSLARSTGAYALLAQRMGEAAAQSLVKSELQRVLPKYQETWNQNLAAAYTDYFSVEELNSLAAGGPLSQYVGKLEAEKKEVSRSMQAKSTGLMDALVREALTAAAAKMPSQ